MANSWDAFPVSKSVDSNLAYWVFFAMSEFDFRQESRPNNTITIQEKDHLDGILNESSSE